jgi:hypothetical protein
MRSVFQRAGIVFIASIALMSFRLVPEDGQGDRLLYDVRGAFVAAQPDVSPRLMQMVHEQVSNAIGTTMRHSVRPRVVLTIRLASVSQTPVFFANRASARVIVRAAAVASGEVIAEAKFTATIFGLDAAKIEDDLAYGIAQRVIKEFQLDRPAPSTLATALFP